VRLVNRDYVHSRLDEFINALVIVRIYRRAAAQPAAGVLAGAGILGYLVYVFYCYEALEMHFIIYEQQFLDFVLVQDVLCLFDGGAGRGGNKPRGHHLIDAGGAVLVKPQIAPGNYADKFPAVHDRQAGDVVLFHQLPRLFDDCIRRKRDGRSDNARLGTLDLAHFIGLARYAEIAVDDAYAAFLCERDCKARVGYRVHSGGDDWNVQRDVSGQPRCHRDFERNNVGLLGNDKNVVERDSVNKAYSLRLCGYRVRTSHIRLPRKAVGKGYDFQKCPSIMLCKRP
jgi:hypothetical protein